MGGITCQRWANGQSTIMWGSKTWEPLHWSNYINAFRNVINDRKCTRIKNLGAICYMNSMIQQFYINETFRNVIFLSDDQKEVSPSQDSKGKAISDDNLLQIERAFGFLELNYCRITIRMNSAFRTRITKIIRVDLQKVLQ